MEMKANIARLMNGDSKIKAFAAVTLTDGEDTFTIHDIKVIAGAKGPFMAMPSKMTTEGAYIDIAHPLSSDTRSKMENAVMAAYQEKMELAQQRREARQAMEDTENMASAPAPEPVMA